LKRYFKNIAAILAPAEKKRFTTLIILNLAISIADIVSLALLVYIINFYTQPAGEPIPSFLPGWLFNRSSIALILLFFILFSLKNLGAWLVHRAQCNFLAAVASRLSRSRLMKYLHNGYEQYVETDSSVHIRRIYFHPIEFCQHILDGIQQVITQAALITLAIIAILIFNAQLFLLLFIMLLPPVVLVFYYIKRRLKSVRTNTRTTSERSLQHLQEALAGYVESNIYNKSEFFLHRYAAWQQQFYRHFADFLVVQGTPTRIIEVFALLGLFILIVIGQWYGNGDAIVTVGAFMAAAYKIIPGIVKILNISGQMNSYEYTLKEDELVNAAVMDKTGPSKIQSISFNDVGFQYNGETVLDHFSVQIRPGDFLAITGASGKGKTTILNLLLGFLQPGTGTILVNDSIPASEKLHWRHIAYVKQQTFLIHDTIMRNIVLDEQQYDEEKLRKVIERSGLSELGLEKMIAENGKNISGGQRQRIAIARALYKEASLIILDEPFNELDENAEAALLQHLKELAAAGKMIVLITHNSAGLSYCNKKISLDD
jgi:ABC-type multidrug transport system fused ATPase/permease subunit